MEYTFTSKKYKINFVNRSGDVNDAKSLTWRIADTPVAHAWLETVRWHLALPDCHVFENQMSTFIPTLEKTKAVWQNMRHHVDEANSGKYVQLDGKIEMPNELDLTIDNQPLLNFLHYEFHRFEEAEEKKRFGIAYTYDPLMILNTEIHKLEKMVKMFGTSGQDVNPNNILMNCSFFLSCDKQNLPQPGISTIPVEPEWQRYWNYAPDDGDLLLGYHTVGKNIMHCWCDNDVDLVKKNMLRPQREIGNEVLLMFRGRQAFTDEADRYVKRIHEWVKNNNLESYVDLTLPEHNVSGQPLLGKIEGIYSRQEISDLFENYIVQNVEII
ncbi:hypothetical protein UFOVP71_197 [uncultured Caudovirales phage]|uniref:Uncharacterized protein n=1 Tax=uncultured Caudovirales phage TaxID=2100421 RepID=A0A6J5TBJ9_9CAUD|nr:hypothetical protein UFOVP71_197 [uncultured Caudovirales phage]